MRHRKRGRRLGRSSPHRKALLQNLANALFLTEREEADLYPNPAKVKGRIVTTLPKAKEARSLIERCIRIACKSLADEENAEQFATDAEQGSDEWKQWRTSDQWQQWCAARAPVVAARRRVFSMLRHREAVSILFEVVAPRYVDRPGGYTRVLKLAKPRLGDAGARAILELVGTNDRVAIRSERPAFDVEEPEEETGAGATAPEASATPVVEAPKPSTEPAPEAPTEEK
jgi:large subunit ribosomal protein L17